MRCFVDHLPVLMTGGVHRDASGGEGVVIAFTAWRVLVLPELLYTEQERCSKLRWRDVR